MNTISIRKVSDLDIPQLIELFEEFSNFENKSERMINSVKKMKSEMDYFNCFVAVSKSNQIVGYLSYFFCFYTWSGKSLYMDDLFVKPKYRGEKIGRKLINSLIELGKKENCYKIRWQVAKWNKTAIQFYKSLGAEIEDVEFDCDLVL